MKAVPLQPAPCGRRRSLPGVCRTDLWQLLSLVLACLGLLGTLGVSAMEAEASELRRTAVVRAVEKNRDAIVNIRGQKMIQSASSGFEQDAPRRVNGMGTGVVIDPRGYIITNHHVVDGVANVQVTLANGEKYRARLLAHDPRTDLALIKIAPREKKLPVIRLGTSSDLMPGEPVIAVGNAYGYENTVTRGIISALHRRVQVSDQQEYDNLIQTDASINPGNSGGPLLNIDGEMIGLNAAVRVGAQGIGFALPIDDVLAVSSRLMSIKRMDRNWHGVVASHVAHPGRDGILVKTVEAESPAAKVGIQAGDVITRVDSVTVRNPIDIERALLGRAAGDAVSITYRRKDQPQESRFVLESYEPRPRSQGDDPWQLLGLRFEELRPSEVRSISDRYRGGLRITEVRESSPAHQQGFRRGDILVGMHIWETVSSENVQYVLRHKDLAEFAPVKFYILRGDQTLYGHLRMAAADAR